MQRRVSCASHVVPLTATENHFCTADGATVHHSLDTFPCLWPRIPYPTHRYAAKVHTNTTRQDKLRKSIESSRGRSPCSRCPRPLTSGLSVLMSCRNGCFPSVPPKYSLTLDKALPSAPSRIHCVSYGRAWSVEKRAAKNITSRCLTCKSHSLLGIHFRTMNLRHFPQGAFTCLFLPAGGSRLRIYITTVYLEECGRDVWRLFEGFTASLLLARE